MEHIQLNLIIVVAGIYGYGRAVEEAALGRVPMAVEVQVVADLHQEEVVVRQVLELLEHQAQLADLLQGRI